MPGLLHLTQFFSVPSISRQDVIFFVSEQNLIVFHIFLSHSSVDKHLSWFHLLAAVKRSEINMDRQVYARYVLVYARYVLGYARYMLVYARYMPFECLPRSDTALPCATWETLTLIYTVDTLVAPTFSSAYIPTLFYVHCVLSICMSMHMFALPSETETAFIPPEQELQTIVPAMRVLGMDSQVLWQSIQYSQLLNHLSKPSHLFSWW